MIAAPPLLLLRRRRRRHVGSPSNWGICLRVPPTESEGRGEKGKKDDLESRQEREEERETGDLLNEINAAAGALRL